MINQHYAERICWMMINLKFKKLFLFIMRISDANQITMKVSMQKIANLLPFAYEKVFIYCLTDKYKYLSLISRIKYYVWTNVLIFLKFYAILDFDDVL